METWYVNMGIHGKYGLNMECSWEINAIFRDIMGISWGYKNRKKCHYGIRMGYN